LWRSRASSRTGARASSAWPSRPSQSEEGTFQWLPWLQQAGGYVDRLDSPEARAALQIWVDLVNKGYASKDVLTMRQYEATSTFMAGNAAMVVSGPWELPRISKEVKFDWAVALLPVKDDRNTRASALGEAMFTVMKGAPNREGALKVVEFMYTDGVLATAWSNGRLPPRSDVKVENPVWPQAYGVFAEQMKYARVRGPHPNWPELSRPIQVAIQEAISGKASPEEALKKAAASVQPILNRTPLPPPTQ
jgi:multiple sugar transport system substrate-binding protein